jgi:hypothetical protein
MMEFNRPINLLVRTRVLFKTWAKCEHFEDKSKSGILRSSSMKFDNKRNSNVVTRYKIESKPGVVTRCLFLITVLST